MKTSSKLLRSAITKVLRLISKGTLSRADAAIELGCSVRHVNRLMAAAGVRRPRGAAREAREAARLRKESRQWGITVWAAKAKAGLMDVSAAAARAGCSERTIYRHMRQIK